MVTWKTPVWFSKCPNVRMSIQQTSHESKEGFGHTLSFTRSTICHPFKKSTSLKNEKRSEGWWREHITAISLSRQFIWRNCATKSELPKAPWAVFVFHCLKTPFFGSFAKLHSRFCFSLFKKNSFWELHKDPFPKQQIWVWQVFFFETNTLCLISGLP